MSSKLPILYSRISFSIRLTSNARLRSRLTLSRRNSISELSTNCLLIHFQKPDLRFKFLDRNYPSVNPYKKVFFLKKPISIKFRKTNDRFRFLDPNYPSVNPYKKKIFPKEFILCVKNSISKKLQETNDRFRFLDPNYPSVNPY
jgi:hypothetical protein